MNEEGVAYWDELMARATESAEAWRAGASAPVKKSPWQIRREQGLVAGKILA